MGDQAGVATQLAVILQRPRILTALGPVLAPLLAGAPRATINEEAATRGRSRSNGSIGGSRPAQLPPSLPTVEQPMIAFLERSITSFEGVINTLCHELAET